MKKILVLVIAAIILNLSGCEQQQKKSVSKITVPPDIRLSVVAQYVRDDGGRYLTQQQYEIFSSPQAIIVNSDEPYGKVVWSVQEGIYTEPKNKKFYDKEVFSLMTDKDIAEGLMQLYLASLGKIQIQTGNETLNFDGQVYECVAKNAQNIKLYRNKTNGKVDLATSGQDKNGLNYFIYGYNYQKIGKKDGKEGFYATKVDIYLYKSAYDKKLLAQLNCSLN